MMKLQKAFWNLFFSVQLHMLYICMPQIYLYTYSYCKSLNTLPSFQVITLCCSVHHFWRNCSFTVPRVNTKMSNFVRKDTIKLCKQKISAIMVFLVFYRYPSPKASRTPAHHKISTWFSRGYFDGCCLKRVFVDIPFMWLPNPNR